MSMKMGVLRGEKVEHIRRKDMEQGHIVMGWNEDGIRKGNVEVAGVWWQDGQ
jgi:hypothetical protein